MITGGIDKVVEWLKLNNIIQWSLCTNAQTQANNKIFESNIEYRFEDEIERMKQVVALSQNPMLYINAKQNTAKSINNYTETWRNMPEASQGITGCGTQGIGAIPAGYMSPEEVDRRIETRLAEERYKRDREDFERERKEFRQEKREFDRFKNGAIGTLLEKAMPYLGGVLGIQPLAEGFKNVAGVGGTAEPSEEIDDIPARRAEDAQAAEQEVPAAAPAAPAAPVAPAAPQAPAVPDAFTDEEADKLYVIMKRYKDFDPDYLQVIEKFVEIATKGEGVNVMGTFKLTYEQIKDYILKS